MSYFYSFDHDSNAGIVFYRLRRGCGQNLKLIGGQEGYDRSSGVCVCLPARMEERESLERERGRGCK